MNFLLVGNSRLHWAEYVESEYKFFHTNKNDALPENINLDKIIWASVGESPMFILKKENETYSDNYFRNICHYWVHSFSSSKKRSNNRTSTDVFT